MKNGLCGKTNKPNFNEHLLSLSSYQQLQKSNSSFFILPMMNAKCLPDEAEMAFKIVSYDAIADVPYDYWGEFKMAIKLVEKFNSFRDFQFSPTTELKNFGFKNTNEAITYFMNETGQAEDGVAIYTVKRRTAPELRNPIGAYRYLPTLSEIRFLSEKELARQVQLQALTTINFQARPVKELPHSVSIPISSLSKEIRKPSLLQVSLSNLKIPTIEKDKPIYLKGTSYSDQTPVNMAQYFSMNGYSNLLLADPTSLSAQPLTPSSVRDLQLVEATAFLSNLNNYLVIDVRMINDQALLSLKSEWKAPISEISFPYLWDAGTRARINLSRTIDFNRIKIESSGKIILLIGKDDYDWRPILLCEKLRAIGVKNISWLREGYEGLNIRRILGLLDDALVLNFLTKNDMIVERQQPSENNKSQAIIFRTVKPRPAIKNSFELRR